MLPLPNGCFQACAPHRYDRWRPNMRDPQLAEGWKEGYKWHFCGLRKQFMEEMTGWFQETNVKKKKCLTCRQTFMPGTPVSLIAGCECTHHSRKEKKTKQKRMVLYFFSSSILNLVIQVLRTVRHCKHKLPKTGLVFPPEGCIFFFFFFLVE